MAGGLCVSTPYGRTHKHITVRRVHRHKFKKLSKPARVKKALPVTTGKDKYPHFLMVLSLLEIDFMKPRLKKNAVYTLNHVALPVTKTPCYLSPVTL